MATIVETLSSPEESTVDIRLKANVRGRDLDPPTGGADICRRMLDVLGALSALIAFAPAMAIIYCAVALEGGKPIFKHNRIGKGGTEFGVLKFRTMRTDAGTILSDILRSDARARKQWGEERKLTPDPRITGAGRILRRSSLDELPQLINVLRGEMSLVGPRPVPRDELALYGRSSRHYLSVKPGLTGLWQVSGRNDVSYRRRVALDRLYVSRRSIGKDIRILLATILEVARGGGK